MGAYTIESPQVYARPQGRSLRCTIFRPEERGTQPIPAIVLIHGGGWFGGMRQQVRWYGRHLAARGYLAMAIDYRRMFRYAFPACVYDCKAAVRWLRLHADRYNLDPDRIGAMGNSAGGHLSCMLAVTRSPDGLDGDENPGPSSAIQAAVSLYGPQDLRYYLRPDYPLRAVGPIAPWYIRNFVHRDHGSVDDPFAAASPPTYVHNGAAPILFIHGTNDRISPFEHSVALHERLRAVGVDAELVAVPNRNHAFDFVFLRERAAYFEHIMTFLDRHLSPSGTSPMKESMPTVEAGAQAAPVRTAD